MSSHSTNSNKDKKKEKKEKKSKKEKKPKKDKKSKVEEAEASESTAEITDSTDGIDETTCPAAKVSKLDLQIEAAEKAAAKANAKRMKNQGSSKAAATADTPSKPKPVGWKALDSMSVERDGAAAICYNGHQFLVIGGIDCYSKYLSSCEYFDTDTNKWNPFPIDMPDGRTGLGVAKVGNKIYVMGGTMDDSYTPRSDLISIDVSGGDLSAVKANHWDTGLAPMEHARCGFACVSHSKYIYVFAGGENGDTAERYDTETNEWTSLPTIPTGKRKFCAAGVVGNKIYIIGGNDGTFGGKRVASTLVFDTSKTPEEDPWEVSTVFCMNTPRKGMSVAVVDHFVLAIGGRDESNNLLSTIEVLDTQRNTWKYARAPMTAGMIGTVAGFYYQTKEIIVVGGNDIRNGPTDATEMFHFEKDLVPYSYGLCERGQKVIGDKDQGNDELGLLAVSEALAELLIFVDLMAPFVLGIFGKSGDGKTFFSNLMIDRMIKIQKKPADRLVRETFAGHIYVIKFDAWTSSKGDIWSSLMIQILEGLNKQLQFEEAMGQKALKEGAISTIEVFRDLASGEAQYLKEISEDKKISDVLKNIEKNGDRASLRLLQAINANYEEDNIELKRIEEKISLKETIKKKSIREGGVDEDLVVDGEELKELKEEKTAIQTRNLVLEGFSLRDTIAKNTSNLGVVHKFQKELKRLSDGMFQKRQKGKDIFPRGDPRIILVVENLDRCEQDVIVQVIEALQLLVKTKLFVATLAIDPRYVTHAIEKKYEGTPLSGMDFLEKIIQIPFRVPGIQEDNVDDFLNSQIEVEGPNEDLFEVGGGIGEDENEDEGKNECDRSESKGESIVESKNENKNNESQIEEDLPYNRILLTLEDRNMLSELFKLIRVGPSCMRRIINVFKVLLVIWKRDTSGKYLVDEDSKRAMVFLMLLASGESTRETMSRIFEWMELGTVKYHCVACDTKNGDDPKDGPTSNGNNLADLLKRELKKSDEGLESSFIDGESKEGTLMAAVDKYLAGYEWNDIGDWNKICSQFLLARSFSF